MIDMDKIYLQILHLVILLLQITLSNLVRVIFLHTSNRRWFSNWRLYLAGAVARNDQLSELYHKRAIAQLAIAKGLDAQAQTTRRMEVERFRNVRNHTALSGIR